MDKRESLEDVCGYLNNWADLVIIRHKDIQLIEKFARYSKTPVINAMTDQNHPCEVLADMYSLSKIRDNFISDKYLFCGKSGNIGLTWKEASEVMGFELSQCCGAGYEMNAPRSGSSHYTFRKAGCQPIMIPKHEPIKKVYVELVKQIVESEAEYGKDAE